VPFSLNSQRLQIQEGFDLWQGLCPWTLLGQAPHTPIIGLCSTLAICPNPTTAAYACQVYLRLLLSALLLDQFLVKFYTEPQMLWCVLSSVSVETCWHPNSVFWINFKHSQMLNFLEEYGVYFTADYLEYVYGWWTRLMKMSQLEAVGLLTPFAVRTTLATLLFSLLNQSNQIYLNQDTKIHRKIK